MAYVPPIPNPAKAKLPVALAALLATSFLGVAWVMLFVTNVITLRGVPYSVLMQFWQDPIARNAYFSGNGELLHNRLSETGVEASLKAYYQPKIADGTKLDQRVQQILYNHTGYVAESYQVSDNGRLMPKE
ncbi:MAG TPA: hypothetical protein V6D06_12610 [Trichocoleus sp.]